MMASPASVQKIHPVVNSIPIPLWIFSLVCDVIYAMDWGGVIWNDMAFYTMVGGLLGALAAAIPGYLDYRSVTIPPPRMVGQWQWQTLIKLSIVLLFAINLWLRMGSEPGAPLPIILSALAIAMLGASGWLRGDLVYVHGAAVELQAKGPDQDEGAGTLA